MITIRDVTRRTGISVAIVLRVLDNSALVSLDTRDAVIKAVTQLGHRPSANAQALATQASDTIGVVMMDVPDTLFGVLVKAVDTVAQQHQKYILIGNGYHKAGKGRYTIEVLVRQRCLMLIVYSKVLSDDELSDFMQHTPGVVLINHIAPGSAHHCVGLDNVSGALAATRMLFNHGRQRTGYLSSNHGIGDDDMCREGWSKALQEQGTITPDSWVGSGSPDMQGGETAVVELLGRNLGLTAVFVYNDNMAAGVLMTLKGSGIVVSQHLLLIGFGDISVSRYTDPQLATMCYLVMSMTKLATELALLGVAGKLDHEVMHCFMSMLVRRHSVVQRQAVGPIIS